MIFLIAPIVGALLAAGISAAFSIGGTVAQNKYNAPKSQLRRLRKAGLPMSYMYQGNVATQSSAPSLSIDPDLGVTETNQLRETTRLNDAQIEKINEEIDNIDIEGDILSSKRNIQLHEEDYLLDPKYGSFNKKGQMMTQQMKRLRAETAVKQSDAFLKRNVGEIKAIEKMFTAAKSKADIAKALQTVKHMLIQDKVLNQLYDIRLVEQSVNKVIGGALEDGEPGLVALYGLLLKLFSKI